MAFGLLLKIGKNIFPKQSVYDSLGLNYNSLVMRSCCKWNDVVYIGTGDNTDQKRNDYWTLIYKILRACLNFDENYFVCQSELVEDLIFPALVCVLTNQSYSVSWRHEPGQ